MSPGMVDWGSLWSQGWCPPIGVWNHTIVGPGPTPLVGETHPGVSVAGAGVQSLILASQWWDWEPRNHGSGAPVCGEWAWLQVAGVSELPTVASMLVDRFVFLPSYLLIILLFLKLIFYWRIIALQNFPVFHQTSTWISHRYTYIPSNMNLPPISLPIPPPRLI